MCYARRREALTLTERRAFALPEGVGMERCARCGGRLYAFWRKPGTHLELPFCVVHNNAHRAKLLTEGWLVRLFAQV